MALTIGTSPELNEIENPATLAVVLGVTSSVVGSTIGKYIGRFLDDYIVFPIERKIRERREEKERGNYWPF